MDREKQFEEFAEDWLLLRNVSIHNIIFLKFIPDEWLKKFLRIKFKDK